MASRAQSPLACAGLAVLALVVLLGVAQPAAACSRGVPDGTTVEELHTKDYRRAYAAIVGRLIEVRPVGSPGAENGPADFHYRIERVYKGGRRLRRGRVVTVRGERSEAACGLPGGTGRRYGLLLHRRRTPPPWRAGLFDAMSPRELREAARAQRGGGPLRRLPVPGFPRGGCERRTACSANYPLPRDSSAERDSRSRPSSFPREMLNSSA